MLKNKKILLIAPKFYDYENEIIKEIKKNNGIIDYIPLFPDNFIELFILKIIKRFDKELYQRRINKFFLKCIKKNNKKYDLIFVISGETLNNKLLEIINSNYKEKNGESILYLWTPISRYKEVIETLSKYDKIFSFDRLDCENYKFKFRPTFYSSYLENFEKKEVKIKYKLFFLGMFRDKRYKECEALEKKMGKNFKFYLYFNRIYFYIGKMRGKIEKSINYSKLQSKPISRYEMYSYFMETEAIFDEAAIGQNGLTQRIFDGIKLEKKIVTTNSSIKEYDFYNENNILVVPNTIENLDLDSLNIFLEKKYKKIEPKIIERYSIGYWLECILEDRI